jgi:hypothetical protein
MTATLIVMAASGATMAATWITTIRAARRPANTPAGAEL